MTNNSARNVAVVHISKIGIRLKVTPFVWSGMLRRNPVVIKCSLLVSEQIVQGGTRYFIIPMLELPVMSSKWDHLLQNRYKGEKNKKLPVGSTQRKFSSYLIFESFI